MPINNYHDVECRCKNKAEEIKRSDFFRFKHAGANCVKTLLEIMSHYSATHRNVYESVKDITFSSWKKIVFDTGLIKEFTDRGFVEVVQPGPGVFAFWETWPQGCPEHKIIWGVGLCISEKELYWMDMKGRAFIKENIVDKKPVFYGILNG